MGVIEEKAPELEAIVRAEEGYGTVESQNVHLYSEAPNGYALHSISKLWNQGYKPGEESTAPEPLREYYTRQNALLTSFAKVTKEHPRPCMTADDWQFMKEWVGEEGDDQRGIDKSVRQAIIWSNMCTGLLLCAQLYAFLSSGSLSMLAVFLDAFLDMVSGIVVTVTWYMKNKRDIHRYPVGRARLEPLGVISMACLMTAGTLLTLEQSVAALTVGPTHSGFEGLTLISGGIILSALLIKLTLYHICSRLDDASVQALALDHFNDVISNAVSFCTILVAQHALWWVDPAGGIFISIWIIRNWASHTLEHFDQLLGKAADVDMVNVITFMACNHHEDVTLVDTVRAYHVGNGLYVEVDIVLDTEMPLHKAHDIGESLQFRIEQLEGVERSFVHIDTDSQHSAESEHKLI